MGTPHGLADRRQPVASGDRNVTAYNRRGADPDAPAVDNVHTDLMAALRQINPDQRRAIVLHHLCDLSVADVAVETRVPVGTVKARLSRGRRALATLLTDNSTEVAHHD